MHVPRRSQTQSLLVPSARIPLLGNNHVLPVLLDHLVRLQPPLLSPVLQAITVSANKLSALCVQLDTIARHLTSLLLLVQLDITAREEPVIVLSVVQGTCAAQDTTPIRLLPLLSAPLVDIVTLLIRTRCVRLEPTVWSPADKVYLMHVPLVKQDTIATLLAPWPSQELFVQQVLIARRVPSLQSCALQVPSVRPLVNLRSPHVKDVCWELTV
jgi:hypothetical protein